MGFFREQVRPRLTVESVFAPRVPRLRKHGGQWRGPCPIHGGSDDNFVVSERTLAWYCHSQCQVGGGPIEFLAAIEGGPDAVPVRDAAPIIRELAAMAGVGDENDLREPPPAWEPEPEVRPALAEVVRLWKCGRPVTSWASAILEHQWGVDPAAVETEVRVLEGNTWAPRWAKSVGRVWGQSPYRLIVPLRDERMRPVSFLARPLVPVVGLPKTGSATGVSSRGLIMANDSARRAIREQRRDAVIVMREGERDWLCEASRGSAAIGIRSGAWTAAHAAALPPCAHVVLGLDDDAAGRAYAASVERTLQSRGDVTWELDLGRAGAPDQMPVNESDLGEAAE